MKIGIYIYNNIYNNINLKQLNDGNPGIGGTEYVMFLVAYNLSIRNNDIQVYLYVEKEIIGTEDINIKICSNIEEAAKDAAAMGCTRFVFDPKWINWFDNSIFADLPTWLKLIPWNHNISKATIIRQICMHPNFGRLVCVGEEVLDLYRDDWTFKYSDYIYNCVPINEIDIYESKKSIYSKRKHIVTYIGSLNPRKTFHVLAEIWPEILKSVPDAQLYVIGSASLYDNINEYGKFHIAEKTYENMFMKYLTKNEKILSSVHFIGAMGVEKNKILAMTKVGVPNPVGKTETFCLSAVEMQLMGCTVTAMQAPGYFNTFFNGYVVKSNKNNLIKSIVKLLLSDETPQTYDNTIDFIRKNFSIENVICQWEKLLKSELSTHINPILPIKNKFYRFKWLKEFIRTMKEKEIIPRKSTLLVESFLQKYEKIKESTYRLI